MANKKFSDVAQKSTIVSTDEVITLDSQDGLKLKRTPATAYIGATGPQGIPGTNGLGFTWKNTYSGATTYQINDVVFYNGSSYTCKAITTGNLPTNTTYWDLSTQKGTDGITTGVMKIDQTGGGTAGSSYGTLTGVVNGADVVFTVSQLSYISGSLTVLRNGQMLTMGTNADFIEISPSTGEFKVFNVASTIASDKTTAYYNLFGYTVGAQIDDTITVTNKTWSSSKIGTSILALINDTVTALTTTWSSTKINNTISPVSIATIANSSSGVITGLNTTATGDLMRIAPGKAQTISFSNPEIPTKSLLEITANFDIVVPVQGFWFYSMKAYDGTYNFSPAVYTASTISFTSGASPTINDSANGFVTAGILVGDVLEITGSAGNSKRIPVKTVTAGVITLFSTDTLVTESAGPSITIRRVQHINYPNNASPTITIEWKSGTDWIANPNRVALGKFFWNIPKNTVGYAITVSPAIQYYEDTVFITYAKQTIGVHNLGGNKLSISNPSAGVYNINKSAGDSFRYGKFGRAVHQGTLPIFNDIINITATRGHLFNLLNSAGTDAEYIPHVQLVTGGLYEQWWKFYDATIGVTPSSSLTPTAVPTNNWTVIDIVIFGSGTTPILVWGQKVYSSLNDALLGANSNPNLANSRILETFIAGRLVIQSSNTGLADLFANQTTRILPGNKFRLEVAF